MFRKNILIVASFIIAVWFAFGCAMSTGGGGGARREKAIVFPGGTISPTLGVGFDVNYDPTLDSIVPGYKILTVAYTNNSMDLVQMDPDGDRWYLEDRRGKKVRAVINLRNEDPDTWGKLPKRLQVLIEYPLLVSIGGTETVDLLFKDNVNLGEFKSVSYKIGGTKKEYKIVPRLE